jgi:hypothetical protein
MVNKRQNQVAPLDTAAADRPENPELDRPETIHRPKNDSRKTTSRNSLHNSSPKRNRIKS